MRFFAFFYFFIIIFLYQGLFSQNKFLEGRVFDQDSVFISDASIIWLIKRTDTTSDNQGRFSIDLSGKNDTLLVTRLGYDSQKIPADKISQNPFNIILTSNALSLPPFIVSATGRENLRLLPGKTDFIDLNAEGKTSLGGITAILKYLPDIQVIGNGAGGGVKTIKMNGFNSGHIAYKIEGMTINSAQNGGVDLSLFNIGDVENIVLKYGGNSVDAGPSAMGGVINISLLPEKYKTSSLLSASVGSFGNYSFNATQKVALGLGNGIKLSLNYRSGEDDFIFQQNGKDKRIYNAAFYRSSIHLGGLIKTSDNSGFKWLATYFKASSQIPSSSPYNIADQKNSGAFLFAEYKLDVEKVSQFTISANARRDNMQYRSFNYNTEDEHSSDHLSTTLAYHYIPEGNKFKLFSSFEINNDRLKSSQIEFRQESNLRYNLAASYQMKLKHELFSLYSAGMSMGYSQYDHKTRYDYRLGAKIFLPEWEIYSSIYSGYKLPTFNDRYWPVSGNPDLLVEETTQWISGTSVQLYSWLSMVGDISIYKTKNMIRWIPRTVSIWRPENAASVSGKVVALKTKIDFPRIAVDAGITWQKVENNGLQIQYVPILLGSFRFNLKLKDGLDIFAGNVFESNRPMIDGGLNNNLFLSAYGTLDMGIRFRIEFAVISFKVNNIFDKTYYLQNDLPMKGRNYEFSTNFTF